MWGLRPGSKSGSLSPLGRARVRSCCGWEEGKVGKVAPACQAQAQAADGPLPGARVRTSMMVMSATTPIISKMTVRFKELLSSEVRLAGMRFLARGIRGEVGVTR